VIIRADKSRRRRFTVQKYEPVVIEIIRFENEDIITASDTNTIMFMIPED
jgi:hypothetical protein